MSSVKDHVVKAAHRVEDRVDTARARWHEKRGWRMPIRVLPYRGFGRPDRFFVRARVIRDRGAPNLSERDGWWSNLHDSMQRYRTHDISGAEVLVCAGGGERIARADDEGFIELWWEPDEPLVSDRLWHDVELQLVKPPSRSGAWRVSARVMIPPSTSRFGVISDIDDTVIRVGATHPLQRFRALFLRSASERLPFEGAASFYRALQDGCADCHNPLFFVSSSPWNLYEHLVDFFALNGIPDAPLFLRDWGLFDTHVAPGGGHSHKLQPVQTLLRLYPTLPFVLIGDSGQQDAELYERIVTEHGDRIVAVYIRAVTGSKRRRRRVQALAERASKRGCPFVVVQDTLEAARHAAELGLIGRSALGEISEDMQADLARAGPMERRARSKSARDRATSPATPKSR